MPVKQYEQHDFSAGEIDPGYDWRSDTKLRNKSVKSARNWKLLSNGTMTAREGTSRVDTALGDGQVYMMNVQGTVFVLVVTAGAFRIYDKASRVLVQEVDGCAWTADMLPDLVVACYGGQAFVFHHALPTQQIVSTNNVWSVAPFNFGSGFSDSIQQPYYRYTIKGNTITPSALTGNIFLKTANGFFEPGMVGSRLQLQGREVQITGYTDPFNAAATVIQPLYPTKTITVSEAPNYDIGEIIEGADSNAKGQVIAVTGSTVTVLMQTFTDFSYDTSVSPAVGEVVVGLNAAPKMTSAPTVVSTQAPVLDFTEPAMSPTRGYPATGTVHNNRLIMANLPLQPFAIIGSAVNDFTDFEIGVNDDDSFFELIGDQDSGVIQHVFSAEQLLVLTDRHFLYIPESETYPITPTNFTLLRTGPDGASACKPVETSAGVVYAQTAGGAIIGGYGTGDVRRSWKTIDMSDQANHLIKQPRSLAYVSGAPTINQRHVYAANTDGTISVLMYDDSNADATPGWTPWDTNGQFRWLAAEDGECWALVQRPYGYVLEVFDPTRVMDDSHDIPAGNYIGAVDEPSSEPYGANLPTASLYTGAVANMTYGVTIGGIYVGQVTADAEGHFPVPALGGPITIGQPFAVECVPWAPLDAEDQNPRRRKRRISGAVVRYKGFGVAVNDNMRPLYNGGDDTAMAPPVRDETWRFACFGWSYEPTISLTQAIPGPLQLLGVSLEVSG